MAIGPRDCTNIYGLRSTTAIIFCMGLLVEGGEMLRQDRPVLINGSENTVLFTLRHFLDGGCCVQQWLAHSLL